MSHEYSCLCTMSTDVYPWRRVGTHRVGANIPAPQGNSVPLFDFKARRRLGSGSGLDGVGGLISFEKRLRGFYGEKKGRHDQQTRKGTNQASAGLPLLAPQHPSFQRLWILR